MSAWDALLVGDLHLRSTCPARRTDDFVETQWRKVNQIFTIAREYGVPILQVGDISDQSGMVADSSDRSKGRFDLKTLVRYLPLFIQHNLEHLVFAVPGNHDLLGANLRSLKDSVIGVFAAAKGLTVLGHEPRPLSSAGEPSSKKAVWLVGHTYMHRDEPPVPDVTGTKVLVTHEMVLKDKLFREQEDFRYADEYLTLNSGFDVVICGHYHYPFEERSGKRLLINPGAVVRSKASRGDMSMEPGVVLINFETRETKRVVLEHEPAERVFDTTAPNLPHSHSEEFVKALMPEMVPAVTDVERGSTEVVSLATLSDIALAQLKSSGCRPEVWELAQEYLGKAARGE